MNRHPWPGNYLEPFRSSQEIVSQFETLLGEAKDERPLQEYLARVPNVWRQLLPSPTDAWCFDRPPFGSEFVPDFLLCYRNSLGFNWILVELESPAKPPLTRAGRVAAKLNEAFGQLSDWRIWLRRNIAYAQNQLGFRDISAEFQAVIVIGRRHMLEEVHAARYRELSRDGVQVMTYDRLAEIARHGVLQEG